LLGKGTAGVVGIGLIVTELDELQPLNVTFMVYVPEGAVTIPVPEMLVPEDGVIV
jgi:hypothetical protein